VNGDFVCKKINTSRQRLNSSNKEYSTYPLREGKDFQVERVVIGSVRMNVSLRGVNEI